MGARRFAAWTAAALLALPATAAAAGPPDAPDPAFAGGGVTTATLMGAPGAGAGALLLDHSGRPVVVSDPGGSDFGLMRFLADGRPDPAFGGPQPGAAVSSFASGSSGLSALAEQADGGLIAGGWVQRAGDASARFALARWTQAGVFDSSFTVADDLSPAGDDEVTGVAVQADQRIVAAGRSGSQIGLARYNPDGTTDTFFGGRPPHDFVAATQEEGGDVTLDAQGRILVAATATVGGTRRLALARYLPTGAVDTSFDADGIRLYDAGQALAIARQPDGKLLIAGTTGSGGDGIVLRVLEDGTPDPTFGSAGIARLGVPGGIAADVAVQPDGKVVLAGSAEGSDSFLARLRPGGRADPGFGVKGVVRRSLGTTGQDGLSGVGVAPDGGLVVAGTAASKVLLARFGGGDSSDPSAGMTAGASGDIVRFTITAANPGADTAQAVTIAVTPPAGVKAIGISSTTGSCTRTVCSVGAVAAGARTRVTLLARAARPGRLTASATVASPTFDANPGDNAATATGRATALRRPDRTKPRITLKVPPRRVRDVRSRVRLVVGSSEAARVVMTVGAGGRTFAKGQLKFTRKGARTVKLKLTKAGRKVMRRKKLRRLVLVVVVRATDRAGNRATKTVRKTLRR